MSFWNQKKSTLKTSLAMGCAALFIAMSAKTAIAKTQSDSDKSWQTFLELRKKYRLGEINDQEMWSTLTQLNTNLKSMPKANQAAVLQTQATILSNNNYPILAAINAAEALKVATNPFEDEYKRSWTILQSSSESQPIQNLLESVAKTLLSLKKLPPVFDTNWHYIEGNVYYNTNQLDQALEKYSLVKINDRYFFPAKYQQAMIHLESGKFADAIAALKSITNPTSIELNTLAKKEQRLLIDDANIALGRIYYEQKQFSEAMKHYRLISRDSHLFYDSLFEQSWALFMAGNPNHALGMIHSVESPFFKEKFNPEATMLSSIIYYWMCRYNDSRNELAEFLDNHKSAINQLNEFLARKTLDEATSYSLFENTITGVSSEGLGMPRHLLLSAAEKDSMMHVRDQYASVIEELQRLQIKGVFDTKDNIEALRAYLEQWAAALRKDLGAKFVVELKEMQKEFKRLYEQAEFLYVELLMSQKDQLLGKELHANTKINRVGSNVDIKGWGSEMQVYASDDKMEYWKDEVGFHIYRLEPMCK